MLPALGGVGEGRDHNLRWSPEVARRSVEALEVDGGSHKMRVTGYAHVASATLTNSKPYCGVPGWATSCGATWVSRICIYRRHSH